MQAAAGDEEPAKPAPKAKNPLDLLPPSKMVLDSWKRLYSNTPAAQFKQICVNGLWNGADIPNSPTSEVKMLVHALHKVSCTFCNMHIQSTVPDNARNQLISWHCLAL